MSKNRLCDASAVSHLLAKPAKDDLALSWMPTATRSSKNDDDDDEDDQANMSLLRWKQR